MVGLGRGLMIVKTEMTLADVVGTWGRGEGKGAYVVVYVCAEWQLDKMTAVLGVEGVCLGVNES